MIEKTSFGSEALGLTSEQLAKELFWAFFRSQNLKYIFLLEPFPAEISKVLGEVPATALKLNFRATLTHILVALKQLEAENPRGAEEIRSAHNLLQYTTPEIETEAQRLYLEIPYEGRHILS